MPHDQMTILIWDTASEAAHRLAGMLAEVLPRAVINVATGVERPDQLSTSRFVLLGPSPLSPGMLAAARNARQEKAGQEKAGQAWLKIVGEDETGFLPEWVATGISGFIAAPSTAADLGCALDTVRCGGAFVSLRLLPLLMEALRAGRLPQSAPPLTSREQEILRLLAVNMSNKDIARKLQLSVRTVETHRLHIRKKTGAGNRQDLIEVATALGLLGQYPLPADLAERRAAPGFHEDE